MKKILNTFVICNILCIFLLSCSSKSYNSETSRQLSIIKEPLTFYNIESDICYNLVFDTNNKTEFRVPIYASSSIEKNQINEISFSSNNENIRITLDDVQFSSMSSPEKGTDVAYVINYVKLNVELTTELSNNEKVHISSVNFCIDGIKHSIETDINIYFIENLITPTRAFATLETIDLYTSKDNTNVLVVDGEMNDDIVINNYYTLSNFVSVTRSVWKNSNDVIQECKSIEKSITISEDDYYKTISGYFEFALNDIQSPWHLDTLVMDVKYYSNNGKIIEGKIAYIIELYIDLEKYYNNIYAEIMKQK